MNIKDAHKYSIYNMSELLKGKMAGCYSCISVFDVSKIVHTTDDGKTALCPKCGIDSVLSDQSPFELNKQELKELYNYWFKIGN